MGLTWGISDKCAHYKSRRSWYYWCCWCCWPYFPWEYVCCFLLLHTFVYWSHWSLFRIHDRSSLTNTLYAPSLQVDNASLPKQECSHCTFKAHWVLNSIAAWIQAMWQCTFESESVEMCASLWAQLKDVRKALAAVNWCAPSVVTWKNQLFFSLGELEKQIDGHAKIIDGTAKAVGYNSCEWWLQIMEFILMISKPMILITLSITAMRLLKFRSSSV